MGVCLLGRRAGERGLPEKGGREPQWNEASVGRGKAKLFPLQEDSGKLNLQGRFIHSWVFHSYYLEVNMLVLGRVLDSERSGLKP